MGAGGRTITLHGAPHLAPLFARAVVTARGRGGDLPDLEVTRGAVAVDRAHLAAYDRVCGFGLRDALPATYLHVLVFPLQVTLMAERAFPLPLPGLVHVGNRMVQHRPVDAGEPLTLRSSATGLRRHAKGAQVDLIGEVRAGDELVWEGRSTYLAPGAGAPAGAAPAAEEALDVDLDPGRRAMAVWRVPGDIGRRYAGVSGDVNPIHLSPFAAKAFGFPRAIAHGMWTTARALAALEPDLPDAYAVEVAFSRPVLLPSTVRLVAAPRDSGWDFALRPGSGSGEHLRGAVRPVGPAAGEATDKGTGTR